MRCIDFTDIDVYPKYWCNSNKGGKLIFTITSVILEDIERQQSILAKKKTQLILGDCIKLSFKFGHNLSKDKTKENWVDVYVDGIFKVTRIVPGSSNEIELIVKQISGDSVLV